MVCLPTSPRGTTAVASEFVLELDYSFKAKTTDAHPAFSCVFLIGTVPSLGVGYYRCERCSVCRPFSLAFTSWADFEYNYCSHSIRNQIPALPQHINKPFPPIQMNFHVNMLAFVQNSAFSCTDGPCQPLYMKLNPNNTMTKRRVATAKGCGTVVYADPP